jgi:hypothetical protein
MNESYGSVNSHGLWACANILTPKTGTGQIRITGIQLRYSGTRVPSDEYQTSKKYEIAAKINFRIFFNSETENKIWCLKWAHSSKNKQSYYCLIYLQVLYNDLWWRVGSLIVIHSTTSGQNQCSSASNYPRKIRSIDIYECDFYEFGTQYSCNVFLSQSRNWNRNNMLKKTNNTPFNGYRGLGLGSRVQHFVCFGIYPQKIM